MAGSSAAGWELLNERWNRALRCGRVYRCHPEWNVNVGAFTAKGPPDFTGFIVHEGQTFAVCYDAKDTSKAAFPFANIKPHQARDLEQAFRFGQLAFLAVRHAVGNRIIKQYVLPWYVIREAYIATPSGTWSHDEGTHDMGELGWISTIPLWMSQSVEASRRVTAGDGVPAPSVSEPRSTVGTTSSSTTEVGTASSARRAATASRSRAPSSPEAGSGTTSEETTSRPPSRGSRAGKSGRPRSRSRKSSSE